MTMEITSTGQTGRDAPLLSDAEVIRRVRDGESALFEILMRRHNQRLYRTARSVLKDEADVEDVMQRAYINAFLHLAQFEERARFSTWVTRITLNEAFATRRLQRARPSVAVAETADLPDSERASMSTLIAPQADPERQAYAAELRRLIETAVDTLPESYRTVFMLREIEGLSTAESAEGLGLTEEAVRTRLHRARALVRRSLTTRLGSAAGEAFAFHAVRCDRIVAKVLAAIAEAPAPG